MERIALKSMLFATGMLVLFGCKKDGPVPVDIGYRYYPLELGSWVEYRVDSTWIGQGVPATGSVQYDLRERVDSAYVDDEGRQAFRMERFVKDSTGTWIIRDIWTRTRSATAAEQTEENRRYLKLSFPVKNEERWNLNVYNTEDALTVGFVEAHTPWIANGLSFDSTVVVRSYYPNNLIDTVIYRERYAKGVGLVDRMVDSSRSGGLFQGWYFRQTVVAHGP